ncbi:MAG: hypothetical protein ABI411_12555 [Tahibacter sp.]
MRVKYIFTLLSFLAIGLCGLSDAFATETPFPEACIQGLKGSEIPAAATPVTAGQTRLSMMVPSPSGALQVTTGPVQLRLWRLACGDGQSALLLRLDDPLHNDASAKLVFPRLRIFQRDNTRTVEAVRLDGGAHVIPGTHGDIPGTVALKLANAYNTPYSTIDTSAALDVLVDDEFVNVAVPPTNLALHVNAYSPDASSYPDATGPRPINGRYAGNFFDPAKPGEGIVVEVGDVAGQPDMHFLQFAWHSFDNQGAPFWISGGTSFQGRPKHLHMPAAFRNGGRFGGAMAADRQTPWGSVDIEFSNCRTALIDYAANAGLPGNVPAGTGHLQWQRLTGISGYACD